MANFTNRQFDSYIAEEIEKYSGIAMPLKAGLLNRMLIRKETCTKLHPNPEDEFSIPSVGPSYRIISEYEQKFIRNIRSNQDYFKGEEPIIVEKMHPDGYMILNGHHRWAAALMLGYSKIPIQIVNVTHKTDIKEILRNSKHNRRVTFDLDEVIFCDDLQNAEKALTFPFDKFYKERLRLGVPALFRALEKCGYDVWLYSAKYYSIDYIKALFKKYHVDITGIVTGTGKKNNKEDRKAIEELISARYLYTLHIDNDMVVNINTSTKEFDEYEISDASTWSKDVIEIIREINRDEEP